MAYVPIEKYGVIGNMRTVALVSSEGSIDWFCFPRFDSPSVFAAILDDAKGGRFHISATGNDVRYKQFYWPETNILITRFLSREGVGEIQDFMPAGVGVPELHNQIVRRVKVVRGCVELDVACEPAFDYARVRPEVKLGAERGATFSTPGLALHLTAPMRFTRTPQGVGARFVLRENESTTFVLHRIPNNSNCDCQPTAQQADELFEMTVAFWRRWLAKCSYSGRWREIVQRSALVLKLLTYEPTGAIIAAPTCSLPEELGGLRNWDYRYTWIRDAAFTLYALLRIGFTEEAACFMDWLDARAHEPGPDQSLQIVYAVDGRRELVESTLDHLEGYRGSRPVRIGNDAYRQLQLDIYGELMDSVYLYNKHAVPISYDLWTHLRQLTDWVCTHWRNQDEGIWETRGDRQHFVYSKLMCWVALDRALRLAEKRSFPADRRRWLDERDAIYIDIMTRGFSESRKAFSQYYGIDRLDASNLIMPLVFFVSPVDPKMLQTLEATIRSPREGGRLSDGLVYRYDPHATQDGLTGREGTFNMCSFWLVEALTRAGRSDHRKLDQARLLFERILGYANHLGLYSEQTGDTGEALGNYPQALTHLALISAAFNLDRALGKG